MSQKPVISVQGLSVSYGRKTVLSHVYLDVMPGHLVGVVGPNGAGKSTLFKAILDLIDPTAGRIELFGGHLDDHRRQIAYIPQKDQIDWNFPATVWDVVAMGRYPHKGLFQRLNSEDRDIIQQALEDMGIENLKDRQIGQLSGGQQQRVFIARALAQEAELFFLDEPFVGVDITTEEKIIEIMRELVSTGKTCLVVHHDLSTAPDYFDQVILLNKRLIKYGDTQTVFTEEMLTQTYGSPLSILHELG